MDELKPCPFCGGKATVRQIEPNCYRPSMNHPYSVLCVGCNLWFGYDEDYGGRFDTEEEAITEWNKRTIVTKYEAYHFDNL